MNLKVAYSYCGSYILLTTTHISINICSARHFIASLDFFFFFIAPADVLVAIIKEIYASWLQPKSPQKWINIFSPDMDPGSFCKVWSPLVFSFTFICRNCLCSAIYVSSSAFWFCSTLRNLLSCHPWLCTFLLFFSLLTRACIICFVLPYFSSSNGRRQCLIQCLVTL